MIKEAIILAGGLGTRLRDKVPDLPKCMAPVAGRPFIFYVINALRMQGVEKFIFSLGYRHEIVQEYLSTQFATLNFQCSIEEEPLGTGGGIQLACQLATEKNVVVANGDTLFKVDLPEATAFHTNSNAECTLILKPMKQFDRYGVVELDKEGQVGLFKEKQFYEEGNINGGVYILNVERFLSKKLPEKFSFEKDYLEKYYQQMNIAGQVQDGYFIDIGIPEDYEKAQEDLKRLPLDLKKVDKHWTLFIDRDGVINHEKKLSYIFNWKEFRFYAGVEEAIHTLSNKCGKIVIVSNQRGIGKGLMTESDLSDIHRHMLKKISEAGGNIDKIYYSTSTETTYPDRKPNPGMAVQAKRDFPMIDFSRSIMIGNKPGDMLFGRNAGMYTVFIRTTNPEHPLSHPDIDLSFDSLPDFAKAL